jgi:hypothetical protein
VWRKEITVLDPQVCVETLSSVVTVQDVEPEVSKRALEIAASLGRPAIYDSHYVANLNGSAANSGRPMNALGTRWGRVPPG